MSYCERHEREYYTLVCPDCSHERKVVDQNGEKWLVCGSRAKESYKKLVFETLDKQLSWYQPYIKEGRWKLNCIVEGECPESADVWAKAWAEQNNITVDPQPATKGSYLKRNIKMVKEADEVFAFWNGFSYGTAHTIAQAILQGKTVTIIDLN